MKQLYYYSLFFLLFPLANNAQTNIYEQDIKFGKNHGNALVFNIADCSKRTIKNIWKKNINIHNEKSTLNNLFKDVATPGTYIKSISNDPIDVYYQIKNTKTDSIKIITAFVLQNNEFLSKKTHPNEYQNAVELINNYAYGLKKQCIELDLQDAFDLQGKLNDDYVKLQRFKGKLIKNNTTLENKIIQTKQVEILSKQQLGIVEEKLSNQTITDEIIIKLNKQKTSLNHKLIDLDYDIMSYENSITKNKDNISETSIEINKKSQELENQKSVIKDIKIKIEQIKK